MAKQTLSRRTLLRGLLGGAAAAASIPLLQFMMNDHGTAFADGAPLPKRFVLWFFGNGVRLDRWLPAAQGAGYELSEELAPLVNVKDYVSVLTGFENRAGNGNYPPHHGGMAITNGYVPIALSGNGAISTKPGGPSIDQVIAAAIGQDSFIPSLALGVSHMALPEGTIMQFLSHKGEDQPLPPERNPQNLYSRLTGNLLGKHPSTQRLRALDAVNARSAELRKKLGKADQDRLDAHLEGVAQLGKELGGVPAACDFGVMPSETNTTVQGVEPLVSASQAMSDLLVTAFACDATRVASMMWTPPAAGTTYNMLGTSITEHVLSHDPAGQELIHQATVINMQQLAYFLERLKATPEGDGNMLDNTCVLCVSECSEGFTHGLFDQPILVAGARGGALKYPGIHFRAGNVWGEGQNASNVLLSCLRAFVPDAASVGGDAGYTETPCADILV